MTLGDTLKHKKRDTSEHFPTSQVARVAFTAPSKNVQKTCKHWKHGGRFCYSATPCVLLKASNMQTQAAVLLHANSVLTRTKLIKHRNTSRNIVTTHFMISLRRAGMCWSSYKSRSFHFHCNKVTWQSSCDSCCPNVVTHAISYDANALLNMLFQSPRVYRPWSCCTWLAASIVERNHTANKSWALDWSLGHTLVEPPGNTGSEFALALGFLVHVESSCAKRSEPKHRDMKTQCSLAATPRERNPHHVFCIKLFIVAP